MNVQVELVRVGDQVIVDIDAESASRFHHLPKNGSRGTVVKFNRFVEYRERNVKAHGAWELNGAPIVAFEDGTERIVDCDFLAYQNPKIYEKRFHDEWEVGVLATNMPFIKARDKMREAVRVGDLPDPDFWLGDSVTLMFGDDPSKYLKIIDVLYNAEYEEGNHRYEYAVYDAFTKQRESTAFCAAYDLELVDRGPLWREFHGLDKKFTSIAEEAAFENMMDSTYKVRSPEGTLNWTMSDALDAINDGRVDAFNMQRDALGCGHIICVRFDNREIGERMRLATADGFKGVTSTFIEETNLALKPRADIQEALDSLLVDKKKWQAEAIAAGLHIYNDQGE